MNVIRKTMRPTLFLIFILLVVGCSENNRMEDVIFNLSGVKLDKEASLLASESDCCSFAGDGSSSIIYEVQTMPKHKSCDYLGAYSNAPYQVMAFEAHLDSEQVCTFDQESNNSHTQVVIQGNKIMVSWSKW